MVALRAARVVVSLRAGGLVSPRFGAVVLPRGGAVVFLSDLSPPRGGAVVFSLPLRGGGVVLAPRGGAVVALPRGGGVEAPPQGDCVFLRPLGHFEPSLSTCVTRSERGLFADQVAVLLTVPTKRARKPFLTALPVHVEHPLFLSPSLRANARALSKPEVPGFPMLYARQ